MKDFFTSFFNATRDRLSSAFFFNFLLCWSIINWEIFLALFFVTESELPSRNVICYIKEYHYNVHKLLYKPIIIALLISIGLPIINAFIDFIKKYVKKKRDKWVTEYIDMIIPASPEDFVMLKNRLEKTERDYNESMISMVELRQFREEAKHTIDKLRTSLTQQTEMNDKMKRWLRNKVDICKSDHNAHYVIDKNKRVNVLVVTNGPETEWNKNLYKYQEYLSSAYWITSEFPVNKDDAISGKTYTIEYEFNLLEDVSVYKSIFFRCLVDNELQLRVNDKSVIDTIGNAKVVGFDDIHQFDIKEFCAVGINKIQMIVTNSPHNSEYSLGANPYGIVFKVEGVYNIDNF